MRKRTGPYSAPSSSGYMPGVRGTRSMNLNRPKTDRDHIASYRPMSWQATPGSLPGHMP